ncbi:MAG: hypothetical protein ACYDCJ_01010 [Gammaproteobacteria bacterium]
MPATIAAIKSIKSLTGLAAAARKMMSTADRRHRQHTFHRPAPATIGNLTPERQSGKYTQHPGTAKNDVLAEKSWAHGWQSPRVNSQPTGAGLRLYDDQAPMLLRNWRMLALEPNF